VARPRTTGAVPFIIDTIEQYPNEVTLVAVGPMTNIALAFERRPDLAPLVKRLVFMGGNARVPGNVTPAAEFNIWFDPEAAHAVTASAVPQIVMFGLDITNHAPLQRSMFDRIVAADAPLTRLMQHDMGPRFDANPAATYQVWDCITAAWLIDPTIVTVSERLPIAVETTFGPTYGGTSVGIPSTAPTLDVMLDLDVEKFFSLYEGLLTRR
jgi:inosine-uridine nucleoside N-ribohydrolase